MSMISEIQILNNLLTKYTSFVAIDKEVRADGEIVTVKQPLPMPEGVSNSAVGGNVPVSYSAVRVQREKIARNKVENFARAKMSASKPMPTPKPKPVPKPKKEVVNDDPVLAFINNAPSIKPDHLEITDIKWKYLIRSAVRGKNIMMVGPAGSGKTEAAKALPTATNRPFFYFNLGATQDPRSTLIGNTHFKNNETLFDESAFIKAIKTENAVILLDELSRAHPEAWNILMTVLDQGQRYLRLDEAEGSPIVKVADGVTFIATANIGNEYTSTRVMDRAILDRFVTIEMDVLNDEQEFGLLKYMFPEVNEDDLKAVAEIAHHTRTQSMSDSGKVTAMVSTRASVEMAGLIYDGFDLFESAEISIFPFFSNDGGVDSERTYVKQLVQKYVKDEGEALFNEQETEKNSEDEIPMF